MCSAVVDAGEPSFLVVGSPRSGTTLVQRLASELPEVFVTPETHFFSVFFERALKYRAFPLGSHELRVVLTEYLQTPAVYGLPLDVDQVIESLNGRCESPWRLFARIVSQLAGRAAVIGEKTPDHLRWWRPLSHADSRLKFVAVLRDPRAVVSSAQAVPFGMRSPGLLAARWRLDFREIQAATRTLGEKRVLVLRYEDVVNDPELAQRKLAAFVGVDPTPVPIGREHVDLFLPWEAAWKARAHGPVAPSRAQIWRETMSRQHQRQVEAVVGAALAEAGYDNGAGSPAMWRELRPPDWVALGRLHRSRLIQQRRIRATALA